MSDDVVRAPRLCVDECSAVRLAGWIDDDGPVDAIDIAVNGETIATLSPTRYRKDLEEAGIGDGKRAFAFKIARYLTLPVNKVLIRYQDKILYSDDVSGLGGLAFDSAVRTDSYPFHYYIRTAHGTYLLIDKSSGRMQHGSEIDDSKLPLLYSELEPNPKYGFLISSNSLDRFVCGDVVAHGGILPVSRMQISANAIALQHVAHNTFLCAVGEPSADVVFDRLEAREWESFSLHRVRWEAAPQRYAFAEVLISLLKGPTSIASHAEAIISVRGNEQDALLALCFDRLTIDDFVTLLDAIRTKMRFPCTNSRLLRGLLDLRGALISNTPFVPEILLQPDDSESAFWVGHVLRELIAWRGHRNNFLGPDHHVRLGTDLDFLHHLTPTIQIAATGRLYNFLGRYTTQPTRGICAVAAARNEGVYLLEWLAYHQSIGVETFFIYSNDNDDGSDVLLKQLSEANVIYWLENIVEDDTPPQYKAYNHALNVLPQILDYEWALFLDLDEFLVIDPDRFAGLTEYLAWQEQQPVDAIAFNWVLIGSSGLDKWSPDFVRGRFLQRLGGPDRHVKSMFRPQRFLSCQPHFPITDRRVPVSVHDSSGYPHLEYYGGDPAFSQNPKAAAAWVNHYFFKSTEEFVWKRSRNVGVNSRSRHLLTPDWLRVFSSQHCSTDLGYDDRILRCGDSFQKYYDILLSIDGVPKALEEVRNTFISGLQRVKTQLLNDPAFDAADEPLQHLLNSLRD